MRWGDTVRKLGPIGLTVLLIIWTIVVSPYSRYGDNWAVYPAVLVLPVALIWHVALVFLEKPRYVFVLYGFVHLAILFAIWMYCLMKISKDVL